MLKKLNINLFRFNRNTDYLPYYKKYLIKYNDNDSVHNILEQICEIEPFSFGDLGHCYLKIEDYYLQSDVKISDVVAKCGNDLTIEPISIRRAVEDLTIDIRDYQQKFEPIADYLSEEQKKSYPYILEYYSSNTINIKDDYIGEHILLLSSDIIATDPQKKSELIEIVSNPENGIYYHTSLSHRLFENGEEVEEKIERLQFMCSIQSKKSTPQKSLNIDIKQYFKEFNISSYNLQNENIIKKSLANYINLNSKNHDLALNSQAVDKTFSLQIAGEILLESKDKNSDFLIVNGGEELSIFDGMQSKIAKTMGRDIDMPIITQIQFNKLLEGEKNIEKLGFDNHKIKIPFLD